jgi:3-oxoacyl-[acyl-carrier protein] reductase
MDLGIEGRVAVVTGGSRGIGAATAELLEAEGARVLRASRGDGIDVTAPDAADRIAERAAGPVDILVNNAGTSFARGLDELTDADWNGLWELHVLASMRLMRAFAPGMAERGWGRIVNVASSAGKRPSQTNPAYSVSKAAQLSLSRVFADAYASSGVLVNSVSPGPVASSLWLGEGGLGDQTAATQGLGSRAEAIEAQASKVPLGRLAEPAEIAAVVAFLCSERASIVTGAAWSADGGNVPSIL